MNPVNEKENNITNDIKTEIKELTNVITNINKFKMFDYVYESTVKKRRNRMKHLTPKKKKRKK